MTTTKTETADQDIVIRLRAWADSFFPPTIEDVLVAADEIERLREDKLIALAAVESENAFYQEEIERLRDLGLTMRNAQKKYFKERTQENLIASKQAEKAFDDALKEGE
jgi:hypothetical protein